MNVKYPLIKEGIGIFKDAISGFSEDKAMKKSASLAYYTVFSLAPLLLIIIWLVSFFLGEQAIEGKVFSELTSYVGADAAKQIEDIIQKISLDDKSGTAIVIGIGTLVVGATTVFIEIQDSINSIWKVKPKPKQGWKKLLLDRVLSFSIVIGLGFLLIVSLVINGLILILSNYINQFLPDFGAVLMNLINTGITFIVISILFAVIFKFLPDARIKWKYVRSGAIFTAILFIIGKYLIGIYMQYAAPASAYGAAGSIILILLWIYYTAAILYFGAEFTKAYADKHSQGIEPSNFAVKIVQEEIEIDKDNQKDGAGTLQ